MPLRSPEIPALPVLVPLVFLALAAMVVHLHRRGALSGPRVLVGALACGYGAGVLRAVLLPIPLGGGPHVVPWWVYVQPVPLLTADPTGVVLNVALFVPLGVFPPLLTRVRSSAGVLLTGFAFSLGIELVQLLGDVTVNGGRVADVDDLIANTLGALGGFVLVRVAMRVPAVRRVARAVMWPGPRAVAPRERVGGAQDLVTTRS